MKQSVAPESTSAFVSAIGLPVVVVSGHSLVPSLLLLRRCSYHLLRLRVPGFVVRSSSIDYCLVCSTYAGGNCDSNVPSCDRCNTQLHVDLSVFLLLYFLA